MTSFARKPRARGGRSSYAPLQRGWLAVFALATFVAGHLVLPALHVYDHGNDHVHTPGGVIYVDGRRSEEPRSLDEVLQAVTAAAFGTRSPSKARVASPGGGSQGHRHIEPGERPHGSGTDERPAGGPIPHGAGSSLHFGLAFVVGPVLVVVFLFVRALAGSASWTPRPLEALCAAARPRIRGPPAGAFPSSV
ncbi:MAG: hypothetical protein KA712_04900 [Myxococcales bacterium]|nr:hypothetical protein [Myxococcales bacterium]